MNRREFVRSSLGVATVGLAGRANGRSEPANGSGAAGSATGVEAGFPKAPGLTTYVSEFIVGLKYEQIPAEVIELGKKSILDGFGLALAGSVSTMGPLVRQYLQELGIRDGEASVIGAKLKAPARFAAFANGVSIHADDFDDTQLSAAADRVYGLLTHPSVTTLTPAFALCETGHRTGKDFLAAYHAGVEVECKIAEAISPRHYNDGFHSTGTCGTFGSAAACAKLRHLNAKQTAYALGIAAAEAGGLRDNFGSMTKPFQAAHAAENGTLAADLAAIGWTAAEDILEGPLGFFQAAGGGFDPASISGRLGKPWTLVSPGVSIKPFPCGSLTHPAMGEFLDLVRKNDIKPDQVDKIDVGGNHSMTTTLYHHRPMTGLEAKFSMEFGISILLLDRKAGLGEFTDKVVQRPDVQAMIPRVNFYVDPEAEKAGFDKMTSLIRIHLKDGRTISGNAQFAKGSPANPMSYEDVADKFRGSADFANWPAKKAEEIIEAVKTLEHISDMSNLTDSLTA